MRVAERRLSLVGAARHEHRALLHQQALERAAELLVLGPAVLPFERVDALAQGADVRIAFLQLALQLVDALRARRAGSESEDDAQRASHSFFRLSTKPMPSFHARWKRSSVMVRLPNAGSATSMPPERLPRTTTKCA